MPVFHVLILKGDGRRLLRLKVPAWLLPGGILLLVLAIAAQGVVLRDYVGLRRQSMQLAALSTEVGEYRGQLDVVRRRLPEIQREVSAWSEFHSRIGTLLGATPTGGRDAAAAVAAEPSGLAGELERLLVGVRDEGQKLRSLERATARAGKLLAALPSRWPVRGAINSPFGRRRSPWTGGSEVHEGVDIAAGPGTEVKAPAPGVVSFAGRSPGYGNSVVLDHGLQIKTLFGHLQKIDVTHGQKVNGGQRIALTGETGRSTGPHLHYEVIIAGRPVNPLAYLKE